MTVKYSNRTIPFIGDNLFLDQEKPCRVLDVDRINLMAKVGIEKSKVNDCYMLIHWVSFGRLKK